MSAEDELDEIRRRKREELRSRLEDDGVADATTDDADADHVDSDAAATPGEPIAITGADHLQTVAREHDVVLVDFYADWCGPCKTIEPAVESIARETAAAVAKVDVDARQALAARHGVRGVPTLLLYADGEQVERLSGAQGEAQLRGLVEQYVR